LQLANRSLTYPKGIVDDVLVKVGKFIFLVDFMVLDMDENANVPLILGHPFLATGRALIDVHKGKLTLRVNEEEVVFSLRSAMRHPNEKEECRRIEMIEEVVQENWSFFLSKYPLETSISHSLTLSLNSNFSFHWLEDEDINDCIHDLNACREIQEEEAKLMYYGKREYLHLEVEGKEQKVEKGKEDL